MRLPIVMIAGLLLSVGFNTPVMSQFPPSSPTQPTQPTRISRSTIKQYRLNRRLWREQRISNYRYTLSRGCFCLPEARGPVVIEVRNGVTTSITSETGEKVNLELFARYNTIPKLFHLIRDAIAQRASRIDMEYDSTLGYPTDITIDYSFQIADEEEFITVEDLQVLD
ncbi:MAG: DUF6174 domain-containing protein [Nostocaceae cyanobacterium]|nr:DUF6174 domain-containing protein [Nostocaceae cyanobacterium]